MNVPQHEEWAAVAERFGVDLEQVRRDHLVSHVLGALAVLGHHIGDRRVMGAAPTAAW